MARFQLGASTRFVAIAIGRSSWISSRSSCSASISSSNSPCRAKPGTRRAARRRGRRAEVGRGRGLDVRRFLEAHARPSRPRTRRCRATAARSARRLAASASATSCELRVPPARSAAALPLDADHPWMPGVVPHRVVTRRRTVRSGKYSRLARSTRDSAASSGRARPRHRAARRRPRQSIGVGPFDDAEMSSAGGGGDGTLGGRSSSALELRRLRRARCSARPRRARCVRARAPHVRIVLANPARRVARFGALERLVEEPMMSSVADSAARAAT